MGRPVTKVEITLQQIADSLVEIRDLLRQGPADTGAAVGKQLDAAVKHAPRPAKKSALAAKKKS